MAIIGTIFTYSKNLLKSLDTWPKFWFFNFNTLQFVDEEAEKYGSKIEKVNSSILIC